MPKAILRIEKLKKTSVSSAGAHNHRLRETANADPTKTERNTVYVGSSDLRQDVLKRLEALGDITIRKDATIAVEMLLTASPDFFATASQDKQNLWLKSNLQFLKERYGANLVNVVIHRDEKTPHLHAVIVPITKDNRLNCKSVFGEKDELSQLQTDYAQAMSVVGLTRGIEKSFAHHKDVKTFYSELKTALAGNVKPAVKVPKIIEPETVAFGFSSAEQVCESVRENRKVFYRANKKIFDDKKAEHILACAFVAEQEKAERLERVVNTLSIELVGAKEKALLFDKVPSTEQKKAADLLMTDRFKSTTITRKANL